MMRYPKLTMCGLAAALALCANSSRAETVHVRTVTPNVNVHTTIGSATGGSGAGKGSIQDTLQNSDTVSQYGSANGGGVGSGHGGHGTSGGGNGTHAPGRPPN